MAIHLVVNVYLATKYSCMPNKCQAPRTRTPGWSRERHGQKGGNSWLCGADVPMAKVVGESVGKSYHILEIKEG